jgi:aryl-alcohol dehydrogenase-like predicted oxidoreductase
VSLLRTLGAARGVDPTQLALRWLIQRGVVPLAGAKTGVQARRNAGALDLDLGPDEITALDQLSARFRTP